MTKEDRKKKMIDELDEIVVAYGLGDADKACLQQLAVVVSLSGFPPSLLAKLLPALGAMYDALGKTREKEER